MQNIKNDILQCPDSMSFFRIQDARSRPTFGTLMSKRVFAVQGPLHPSFVIATLWIVHLFQAMSEVVLSQQTTLSSRDASMENLQQLQRYSEKLQFEATCVRLWANGIHDQIMDGPELDLSMTDELNRLRRVQPAWIQHLQSQGLPAASSVDGPSFQFTAGTSIIQCSVYCPVKAAPAPRNPSMASAPKNAPFPKIQGADPWTEARTRQQHQ